MLGVGRLHMAVGGGGIFGRLLRMVAKSFLKGGGRIGQGGMCGDPSHGTTPNSCFAMSANSRGAVHVNYCCANYGLNCIKYRKTFHSRSEGKRSCGSLTEVGRSGFCKARLRESNEPPGEKKYVGSSLLCFHGTAIYLFTSPWTVLGAAVRWP